MAEPSHALSGSSHYVSDNDSISGLSKFNPTHTRVRTIFLQIYNNFFLSLIVEKQIQAEPFKKKKKLKIGVI